MRLSCRPFLPDMHARSAPRSCTSWSAVTLLSEMYARSSRAVGARQWSHLTVCSVEARRTPRNLRDQLRDGMYVMSAPAGNVRRTADEAPRPP